MGNTHSSDDATYMETTPSRQFDLRFTGASRGNASVYGKLNPLTREVGVGVCIQHPEEPPRHPNDFNDFIDSNYSNFPPQWKRDDF